MSDARSPAGDAGTLEVFAELAFGRFGQGDYFREVLDALPAAIYATDAAGRITYFNEAAVKLWGCRPELDSSEWCGSWKLFWPDGKVMPHDQCPMAMAIKERRAVRGIEVVAARPDGTRVHLLPFPTPLVDPSGALVGAINLLVDLSDRKSNEHAIQRLAAIVESSDDAILTKDLNGIITSWNTGRSGFSAIPPRRRLASRLRC